MEALNGALGDLAGDRGSERTIASALRRLQRMADKLGSEGEAAIAALDRAIHRADRRRRGAGPADRVVRRRSEAAGEAGGAALSAARPGAQASHHAGRPRRVPRGAAQAAGCAGQPGRRLAKLREAEQKAREAYMAAAEIAEQGPQPRRSSSWKPPSSDELPPLKLEKRALHRAVRQAGRGALGRRWLGPGQLRRHHQSRRRAWTDRTGRLGRRAGALHAGPDGRAGRRPGGGDPDLRRGRFRHRRRHRRRRRRAAEAPVASISRCWSSPIRRRSRRWPTSIGASPRRRSATTPSPPSTALDKKARREEIARLLGRRHHHRRSARRRRQAAGRSEMSDALRSSRKTAHSSPPPSWGRVGVGVVASCEDCVQLHRLAPTLTLPRTGEGMLIFAAVR